MGPDSAAADEALEILQVALGNPYAPKYGHRRRELEAQARWPRDLLAWRRWLETLPVHLRMDEGALVALLGGLCETTPSRELRAVSAREARDLPVAIRDSCAEVANRSLAVKTALDSIVGNTDGMRQVRETCWAAAFGERLDTVPSMTRLFQTTPVLIHGETGTGKELIAKALCQSMKGVWTRDGGWLPARSDSVHLASIPAALVQSALFGHERGAFSGAESARTGVFEKCHDGVVFLDEIAELPPSTQVSLLRTLQEGKARRIGADTDHDACPRVISASHMDLEELVATGGFRLDLLYRLSSVTIRIPPLRERSADIPLLVEKEVRDIATPASRQELHDRFERFMKTTRDYAWPGNVRELHAVVRTLALGLQPQLKKQRRASERRIAVPPKLADATMPLRDVQRWYARRAVESADTQERAAANIGVDRGTLRRYLAGDDHER